MRARNSILVAAIAIAIGASLPGKPAQAETVVRYGISMADIPLTTGQPDRGAGAYQFTGLTIYDPLVAWDMSVADRPGKLVPGLAVETFDSTCCGMAGAFGYEAEHQEISLKIGELGVLPKMRAADAATVLAASGTSCRHQIRDGAGREALHVARILDQATAE